MKTENACKCQNLNDIDLRKDFTLQSQEVTHGARIDKGCTLVKRYTCNNCNEKHNLLYDCEWIG